MALALRGTPTTASAKDGGNVTINMPTGIAEDDVAYVYCFVTDDVTGAAISASGWELIAGPVVTGGERSTCYRKVMGASPDASVTATGSGNAADSASAVCFAYSGADTTTPEDATPTTASNGTGSTNPNPASIVTATDGAVVIPFAGSSVNDASVTAPSGYANLASIVGDDENADCTVAGADKTVTSAGTEDPGTYTTWAAGRWHTVTVAVRPAGGSTYTLAADAGSYAITGTAASLEFGREVVASAGSYALIGTAASLEYGREVAAGAGSYAVTGSDAALEFGREVAADAGSYSLSGTDAALEYGRLLTADAGSYAITGQDATLAHAANKTLVADAGSYAITGTDATLTYAATEEEIEVYTPRGRGLVHRRRGRKRLTPEEYAAWDAEQAAERERKAGNKAQKAKPKPLPGDLGGEIVKAKVALQPGIIEIPIDVREVEQEVERLRQEEEELMIVLAIAA